MRGGLYSSSRGSGDVDSRGRSVIGAAAGYRNQNHRTIARAGRAIAVGKYDLMGSIPADLVRVGTVAIGSQRSHVVRLERNPHPFEIQRIGKMPNAGRAQAIVVSRVPGAPARQGCARNTRCSGEPKDVLLA